MKLAGGEVCEGLSRMIQRCAKDSSSVHTHRRGARVVVKYTNNVVEDFDDDAAMVVRENINKRWTAQQRSEAFIRAVG